MKTPAMMGLVLGGAVMAGCAVQSNSNLALSADVSEQKQLERSVMDVVRKVTPASVSVSGSFSAVIVSPDGYVLSAGHAVKPDTKYTVTLTDGREFEAVGLGSEPNIDMGLIKILEPDNLPVAEMGWSSAVKTGQPCISISNPGGGDPERGPVVRLGYIADPVASNGMIRSTCLMEPGDSGGPLFDMEGRVIAVHSQIQHSLDTNLEVGVDQFRRFWPQMLKAEAFDPSEVLEPLDVGFEYKPVSKQGSRSNPGAGRSGPPGAGRKERVEVESVNPEGIAASSGLLQGDRFVSINGEKARKYVEVSLLLQRAYTLGLSKADVVVERDGQKVTLELPIPANNEPYNAWNGDADIFQSAPQSRPVQPVAGIKQTLQPVAELESVLDDNVVRVKSSKNDVSMSALATVIKRDSRFSSSTLLVSKNSLVGDKAEIKYQDEKLPVNVIARDKENDLVLLSVDRRLKGGVSLADVGVKAAERGGFLLSPHPSTKGRFGVWGSKLFAVDKRESNGYLGVQMEEADGKVRLTEIRDDGPAREFFKAGDLLLSINGSEITTIKEMIAELSKYQPGDKVTFDAERENDVLSVEVELVVRPAQGQHVAETFRGGKSIRRDGFTKVFSHDGRLRPDECGGPVFSVDGEFLGINIARHSRTRSYALPAEVVAEFVNSAQAN